MDKSTLVRVRGVTAMLVFQLGTPRWRLHTKLSQFFHYHYFSKIRGMKPKLDKLTSSTQLYPSQESKSRGCYLGGGGGGLWGRGPFWKKHFFFFFFFYTPPPPPSLTHTHTVQPLVPSIFTCKPFKKTTANN